MLKTGITHIDRVIENALSLAENEPRAIAAYLSGSLAKGSISEYSDIDLALIVEDDDCDALRGEIESIARRLPGYLIGEYHDRKTKEEYWCYFHDKLVSMDILILPRSKIKPSARFKDIMIVKDKDDLLSKTKAESSDKTWAEPVSKQEFRYLLLMQRTDFHYAVGKFLQGQRFEGIENVKYVFKNLLGLKYRLAGIHIWDFRHLESTLSEEYMDLFQKIYSLKPVLEDLKKGQEINWVLLNELDSIYEREHGSLDFSDLDEKIKKRIKEMLS